MVELTPQEIEEILQQFFDVTGKRQYIGARYVPIFGRKDEETIQWDGGIAPYEPLTIVLHEGNSYTSRTYVPIGVNILDQDYWALTGNYNAQVEAYREEVLGFDDRITENADDIVSLDGRLTDAESAITSLKDYDKINAMNPPDTLEPLVPEDSEFDNSSRMTLLLNYAIQHNKVLYIPSGNYYFATSIEITASKNVFIEGEDLDGTILRYTGSGDFFYFAPTSTVINYAHIRNIMAVGNSDANFIHVKRAQNWYFENMFCNLFKYGFWLDNSGVGTTTGNNFFYKCWARSDAENAYGFYVLGLCVSNYFYECTATFTVGGNSGTGRGFVIDSTGGQVLSDNSLINCETANGAIGFFIAGRTTQLHNTNVRVVNCVSDGSPVCISVSNLYSVQIIGCHSNPSNVENAIGINVIDCASAIISDNVVVNNTDSESNKLGLAVGRTNAIIKGNSFIGLKVALQVTDSDAAHVAQIISNMIIGIGRAINGISTNANLKCVTIANNVFNTTKLNYDIRNNSTNAIIIGNAIADILDNSTSAIKANNIER